MKPLLVKLRKYRLYCWLHSWTVDLAEHQYLKVRDKIREIRHPQEIPMPAIPSDCKAREVRTPQSHKARSGRF